MAPVLGRSHLRMQPRHKLEAGKGVKLTATHAPDTDPMLTLTVLSTTGPFPGTHLAQKFRNQVQQCPLRTFFFFKYHYHDLYASPYSSPRET